MRCLLVLKLVHHILLLQLETGGDIFEFLISHLSNQFN